MEHREAVYKTKDDLKHFRIKVQLHRLNTGGGRRWRSLSNVAQQEPETYIFTWQKKAFSLREFEFYGDTHNCTTALENRYNRDITRLKEEEGGRPNDRLFSYVEGDQPNLPFDLLENRHVTIPGHTHQTFATQFSSATRRRHTTMSVVSNEDPVLERPSTEQRLAHRINTPCSQSMYIMADLHHTDDGIETWEEHPLCHIQVDSSGTVSMKPDFNGGKSPYRIETRSRDVYEYYIEPVTETISTDYAIQESSLQAELHKRRAQQIQSLVGTQFSEPPEGDALSVLLLGEIVSAQGFQYDDLYVTAHLQLPEFWEVCGTQELSVVTQISRTRSKHLYNIANFNCPFEYDLIYHNITPVEGDLPHWPCVLVEVCSLDWWDRHRVEGYAHLPLPNSPGVYELAVETWRPTGHRVVDRLRRFFVGGATELSDIAYVTRPSDFEGRYLSKYGFHTKSSGTVNFRFNIIHHSSLKAQRHQSEQLTQAMNRHRGLKQSLAATLGMFQQARQRAASLTATQH